MKTKPSITLARVIIAVTTVLILALQSMVLAQPSPTTGNTFVRGTVVASVSPAQNLVGVAAGVKSKDIALPNAKVFLAPFGDPGHAVASTLSDLSGRFMLKTTKRGLFMLCVEAEGFSIGGGLKNCDGREFKLERADHDAGQIRLVPAQGRDAATLFGTVRLRDGHLPRGFFPSLGINAYAMVHRITASGDKYVGYVNNFGDYVVPQVPVREKFTLQYSIDGEVLKQEVDPLTGLQTGRTYEFSSIVANSAPRVHVVTATANGKPVQVAAPGSQVVLHAIADDPDNDKLEYRWQVPDAPNVVGPNTTGDLVWNVPNVKSRFPITVVVSDKRGGYAKGSISIDASTQRATFSGHVRDQSGNAIERAQVEINGRLINTDPRGWFSFNVPIKDRYVMNIKKSGLDGSPSGGFGPASYIYRSSVTAGRWTLRGANVTEVDPTKPIMLQQKRSEKDCQGSVASRIDWTPYRQASVFDWQDGRGNSHALADLGRNNPKSVQNLMRLLGRMDNGLVRAIGDAAGVQPEIDDRRIPCGPGVKVQIPANSLVDPRTNLPPSGSVRIALSSVNLSNGTEMPGDYTVEDRNTGSIFAMESFGAASVEIGTATQRFNLKPGATATVTIPVDATQLSGGATPSSTIPLLYYDEGRGVWNPEGKLTLTGTGTSQAYRAKVKHFSTLNADILKSGQSCVAVEVDSSLASVVPFNTEVVMQPSVVAPGVIQVRTLNVDSQKGNVIYNLPNNSDIVLTPIVSGTKPDGSSGNVPAGVFVVNTGGPQTGGAGAPVPNPDGSYYAESGGVATGPCASRVTLRRLNPPTLTSPDEFLQGLSFQASNITEFEPSGTGPGSIVDNIRAGAIDYYHQTDPRDERASFNLFKSKNRFGQPLGIGEIEQDVQFANSGDLGFGRDMHCRKNAASDGAFDYACYVTNFGQPPLFLPDQQDANDTADPTKADATVAMEFSRVENPPLDPSEFQDNQRAVKFYVYNTKQPDSTVRILEADLDGHGNRPVPQLCMVCHGGNLASVAADPLNPTGPKKGAFADRIDIIDMKANFLPFDLHLYNFPVTKSKAAQQAAFKILNTEIVRGVSSLTTTGAEIVELIDTALYQGGSVVQLEDRVIANWDPLNPASNPHRFYKDVFGKTCRTCHVSHPFNAPSFNSSSEFEGLISSVQEKVCTRKVMPHAQRTNDVFWQSLNPNMAALLELYGQTLPGWSPAGATQCGLFFQPGTIATSTFQSKILPILQTRCGGCHGTSGLANFGVSQAPATVYSELLNSLAKDGISKYIVPNNSGTSKLFQRISGGPNRMPQGLPPLDTAGQDVNGDGVLDQQELLNWINAGAPGP